MRVPTILIINQEDAVRESLHLLFREEGFQCLSVRNKADALRLLRTRSVSLVILEGQMIETLKTIKRVYPAIKVLLISSYAEAEATQKALANGADNFVLKPLDFDELLTQSQELLLPDTGY